MITTRISILVVYETKWQTNKGYCEPTCEHEMLYISLGHI